MLLDSSMTSPDNPAYYHLGLERGDNPAFALHLHAGSLATIDSMIILQETMQSNLGIASAFETEDGGWGFGGVATVEDSSLSNGWALIRYPVPQEAAPNHESLLPIAASLDFPLQFLNVGVKRGIQGFESSEDAQQLLTVSLQTQRQVGFNSAALYATIKQPLVSWLRSNISEDLETEVSLAMFEVGSRIDGRSIAPEDITFKYPVRLRSARDIHLDVPGDCTGLDSSQRDSHVDSESDSEYKLIPHNVDRTAEQLSLLAGIAFLGQKAIDAA